MIKPLNDNILLEKVPSEKKVGSIILTKEEKAGNVATILAVGPGITLESGKFVPTTLKAGQKVIYREYSGTDYEEDGHKYILIKEEDILAIVE
ncbi:MAG: co-chaperone GroES [Erysipelotrichaceae bacterium]|jgi:chaperonin GroES|nr:co-chaperone GroES [Erysipelotrichaceae bacterium]